MDWNKDVIRHIKINYPLFERVMVEVEVPGT